MSFQGVLGDIGQVGVKLLGRTGELGCREGVTALCFGF